ncbi:hypothetical protein AWB76_01062 [Caballeronia temeraria]|uniref:Lipoprotein n=1 Tax=Caballeronia temeraria TaxID=1777137 RepID=A0A157ZQ89_9BURK|nr:hypothetical protein [Caballeronia temeraria]SAK47656.1 hypothetical protein AWB76_01062 [Caballeronia temeraria]
MKKLAAALLAASVTVPMLCYAQSHTPDVRADADAASQHAQQSGDYGGSLDGTAQSGWTTQPSPQALGQFVYNHH